MQISVILCTYNRGEILGKMLDSLMASTLPSSVEWEIVVVDNNSTDQTRAVVEEFSHKYSERFRYVFEPKQGLSYARNTGIRESRGDVLAFTDDDVTVDPSWLWNLCAPLCTGEWVGAGGRVLPEWEAAPPSWLPLDLPHVLGPFVTFDLNREAGLLQECPVGASMAYRKDVFEKYGGFRTDLGRCEGVLFCGEDSELGSRLLAAGERLRYEPSAIVYHPISKKRMSREYQLAWWFGKARSDVRAGAVPLQTKLCLAGVPFYLFPRLARWSLLWMFSVKPSERFYSKLNLWRVRGLIFECYQSWRAVHGLKSPIAEVQPEPLDLKKASETRRP